MRWKMPAAGSASSRRVARPAMRMSWTFSACAFRTVGKFPNLVFYVDGEADTDIWRVLHGARDISAWMQEPGEE